MDEKKVKIFANSKCKQCHGKGTLTYQTGVYSKTIKKEEGVLQSKIFCDCVAKNIQKYSS